MWAILEAIVLGIVQGIAEFLPISSSAHLIVVSWAMGDRPIPISLNIALHLGTTAAVLIYFWRDWLALTQSGLRLIGFKSRTTESLTNHSTVHLLPALVIGSVPAGVIGILWQDSIEEYFHHPAMTILPLAGVGVLLWLVDKYAPNSRNIDGIGWKQGLLIGCAQALALIPGVSRSGSTIIGARLLGVSKIDAARFSFLLGTPAMLGAALLNYKKIIAHIHEPIFYLGIGVSCLTGCLAIKFLLEYLRRYSFFSFAIYRIMLAAIIAWGCWG